MFEGLTKALSPKPSTNNLLNEIVFPYLNDNLVVWYNNQYAQTFIERGYRGNAMVYAIVRKIGDKEKVSRPQVFIEKDGQKRLKYKNYKYSGDSVNHTMSRAMRSKALEFADNNDLAALLKNPNPYQSQMEFFESISGFYRTCGEAFIYGVGPGEDSKNFGKYTELYVLPSHLVEIVQGTTFEPIAGYRLRFGTTYKTIPAEDVLHIKTWNPQWNINASQLRGQSPLLAGLKDLTQYDAALFASTKSLQNEGAKGIVSPNHADPKLWLNPQQVDMTKQELDSKINGADNLHKVAVSGMPLQYTQIGLSPVALAIIEAMNSSFEKLCACWGVSPNIFKPDATRANLEGAQKALVTDVVIPYLNSLEEGLNHWLAPKFSRADGVTYTIDFDTTIYAELQTDLKVLKEVYGDAWQVDGNEYREMLNLDADPKYDISLVPGGLVPLADITAPKDEETEAKDLLGDYAA